MSIRLTGITRSFGSFKALDAVNLTVEEGELLALLGPSGSGKTTLLRIIAGLDACDPDRGGTIEVNGQDVSAMRVGERKVGFVFQHYALFRHMSVFENVAFGLRVLPRKDRPPRNEIARRVRELLRLVQLDKLEQHRPDQLSGGQRQRVALARALAIQPRVLLLDEPFGALDARIRQELRRWLRRLHDELHMTSIFVTHDQEEALEVADRVVIMNEGRIEQVGAPADVYHHPATPFVYTFLGDVNLFHERSEAGAALVALPTPDSRSTPYPGAAFARPHQVDLLPPDQTDLGVEGIVRRIHAAGPMVKVHLMTADGGDVLAVLTQERFAQLGVAPGMRLRAVPRELRAFTAAAG
ncbi:MAG TPA: sulfate ABC transporter ATP-binding protein [Candidatus Sumerlaeota bacterium]|nr:MAG: Sulfate/thiosulfate import ATP-binding protein CysA [candidate division BRC1 bacterium ADurb.BinA292]HOE97081.1 sulfate ABC transporter ATP-binding protein [Candidatus Sumerlaeota bacterium]HPK02790.1 sulfate ABC transporter ATP-binding protein [Candidatus Sumerlaeota bacterium]